MCGRFSLISTIEQITAHFNLNNTAAVIVPRYNIAPGQVVILIDKHGLEFMSWGIKLLPQHKLIINAQIETVLEKKLFKFAFRQRRCLIVGSGFFEWKTVANRKIPYYFRVKDTKLIGFAGIIVRDSCVILTTKTNQELQSYSVNPRTPVIIKPEAYNLWLDPKTTGLNLVDPAIQISQQDFIMEPVSTQVNNVKFDEITCITPI